MDTPIEGFHLDVKASELKVLFEKKSEQHRVKADDYKTKAYEVERQLADLKDEMNDDRFSGKLETPVERMKSKASEHEEDAQRFKFYAEHVVVDASYRLSASDLSRLEILDVV